MRHDSSDSLGPSGDMEEEQGCLMDYHMHNPYNHERMMRWLTNFDDLQDGKEAAILPHSSLPRVPARTRISQRPKEFREVLLSDKSIISGEMLNRMGAEEDSKKAEDWIPEWGTELKKVKKRQHLSNLRKNGVKSTAGQPARPATYRTKQAKVFRALIATELFSSCSIEAFMKLPVMQRLAKYRDMLEAPGMIKISDPAALTTDLQTHCIASTTNTHAHAFLHASALLLLPHNCHEVWREAQRHFWRHNVFVVDATHTKAVLNGFNARMKSYIGMLHVDLEALDDLDNLACYNPTHVDVTNNQSLQAIRQQNQDLRRLMQECYNLTWVRIHIHSEWMDGEIHDLSQAHRSCGASQNKQCRHIRRYKELCMNTQRRVEHLTWMFCKSLKCKEGTVFIDVEELGLDGVTRIFEVQIDHEKLDEADKKLKAAQKEQREQQKRGRKENSRALKAPAVKKAKIEVIDLT